MVVVVVVASEAEVVEEEEVVEEVEEAKEVEEVEEEVLEEVDEAGDHCRLLPKDDVLKISAAIMAVKKRDQGPPREDQETSKERTWRLQRLSRRGEHTGKKRLRSS